MGATSDAARYHRLAGELRAALEPKDMMMLLLVRDIFQLQWEANRLRSVKKDLMESSTYRGLDRLLQARCILEPAELLRLKQGWARGDKTIMKKVRMQLKDFGLDDRAVYAATYIALIDSFERLDAGIERLERRRNDDLILLTRYGADLAERVKQLSTPTEPPNPRKRVRHIESTAS